MSEAHLSMLQRRSHRTRARSSRLPSRTRFTLGQLSLALWTPRPPVTDGGVPATLFGDPTQIAELVAAPGTGGTELLPAGSVDGLLPAALVELPDPRAAVTDASSNGHGPVALARRNLAALRILKDLDEHSRAATDDERAVLADWVG